MKERGGQIGLVDFATQDDMDNAIRKMDNSEFKNPFDRCTIRVKEDRDGNGGGGGRGRSRSRFVRVLASLGMRAACRLASRACLPWQALALTLGSLTCITHSHIHASASAGLLAPAAALAAAAAGGMCVVYTCFLFFWGGDTQDARVS